MADLGEHNGRPIVGMGIIIRGTGDGLSKAMKAQPQHIDQGQTVYVLIEAKCIDVHHPVEDRKYPELGGVTEVPVLLASVSTIVDESVAAKSIEAQREILRRWEDENAGRLTISDAILEAEHADGLHKRPVPGCEDCDREVELAAQEKAEADAAKADGD